MPFRLRTFGGLSLTGESGPVTGAATQRRKLALLAVLATGGERGVSRDRLLALFWSESDAEHARHALTQSLSALRRELGSDDLFLGSADLSLNPALIDSDVADLETALARTELERAIALYVGPFLDGVHLDHAHGSPEFEHWVDAERARLAGLIADALERLAVGAGALRQAEIHATLLREELHMEPDETVLAIVRQIHIGSPPPRDAAPRPQADLTRGPIAFAEAVVPLARPPGPRHRAARKGRWVLAVGSGLAAAAAALGALSISRSHARAALDPNLIAVAPFDVFDPQLQPLRQGLGAVLSRDLDGARPLRTVSPTVVIRRWRGRGDPEAAATLGRATGARLAVFGTVLTAGQDSIRLTATLLDVAGNEVLGEVQVRASVDRMDLVTDSITRGVLDELNRRRPIAANSYASVGSKSGPALKAFLRGEQFYRRTAWDSAVAYYRRAIALDSTLAPPPGPLSPLGALAEPTSEHPAQAYAFRSAAFNKGLAPRDSLLIVADSLFEALRSFTDDAAWWAQSHRLFATLATAAERYPDDPEVWFQLGDARTHFGYWEGITRGEALAGVDP